MTGLNYDSKMQVALNTISLIQNAIHDMYKPTWQLFYKQGDDGLCLDMFEEDYMHVHVFEIC